MFFYLFIKQLDLESSNFVFGCRLLLSSARTILRYVSILLTLLDLLSAYILLKNKVQLLDGFIEALYGGTILDHYVILISRKHIHNTIKIIIRNNIFT